MNKHTPGPWIVKWDYNVFSGERGIATCGGYTDNYRAGAIHAENRANARLIAAAPELLEAINHIWDYSAKQFEANSDERALWAKVNRIASAAIAAAEGRLKP